MGNLTEIEQLMGIGRLGYYLGSRKLARLIGEGSGDAVLGGDTRSDNTVTAYLSNLSRAMSRLTKPLTLKEVEASIFNDEVRIPDLNNRIFGGCHRLVIRHCEELCDDEAVLRVCGMLQREKDSFRRQQGCQSYNVALGTLLTFDRLNSSHADRFTHFFSERISPIIFAQSLDQDC